MSDFNDQPISLPTEDRYGFDPFARAIADSLVSIPTPEGSVIAINGPWGCGKSSVINLVKHHVAERQDDTVQIIDFRCWWFRGEEALTLAFFRELYAAIGSSVGKDAIQALPKIGARLVKLSGLAGAVTDTVLAPGTGGVVGGALEFVGGLIKQDESVEGLHDELSEVLRNQDRRFIVVIDDIDRLAPDEALLIFRLVKSVGRLPNVVYLLAFDRQIAERVVSERYPSEGPHFLEKIIQAPFELPLPGRQALIGQLIERINAICVDVDPGDPTKFWNLFHEIIAPELRTPRDLNRIANTLAITWPAVSGDVDIGEFICLETLRLFRPRLYAAIRANKSKLVGLLSNQYRSTDDLSNEYDEVFLADEEEPERERLKRGMMRLFPATEAVWKNTHYSGEFVDGWAQKRRACTEEHFDTYFRFHISDDTLGASEIAELVAKAGDQDFISRKLTEGLAVIRSGGNSRAALILEQLRLHAGEIAESDVQALISILFRMADDLMSPADRRRGFGIADNNLRIHLLIRGLTFGRTTLDERSAIFMQACVGASLRWLTDFTRSAHSNRFPREGNERTPEEECLTTESDALALRTLVHDRLKEAAADRSLLHTPDLAALLFTWSRAENGDGSEEVRAWTSEMMSDPTALVQFARAFTSETWSQGMGGLPDLVSRSSTRASVDGLEELFDIVEFRRRLNDLVAAGGLPDDDKQDVQTFLDAWERRDRDID